MPGVSICTRPRRIPKGSTTDSSEAWRPPQTLRNFEVVVLISENYFYFLRLFGPLRKYTVKSYFEFWRLFLINLLPLGAPRLHS